MGQNGIKNISAAVIIAKIDDRGRVKIPAKYLAALQEQGFGKEVYLTSVNGDHILFYPIKVWEEHRNAHRQAIPMRDPDLEEFISRISYWGSETEIDPKGRILIPSDLRVSSKLRDEVLILGKIDYMVIWNKDIFAKQYMGGTVQRREAAEGGRGLLNEFSSLSRNE